MVFGGNRMAIEGQGRGRAVTSNVAGGAGSYKPPANPVRPPAPPKPPVRQQPRSGGGGGGGGYYSAPVAPPAPPKPPVPTETEYLASDSTYQAAVAALAKQLQNYNTDVAAQRSNYDLDYNKSLKDLGYIAPGEGQAAPTWNWEDQLTASGRAYQNLLNDYAARGMLQSTGYGESVNDLTRSLLDQYNGMNQARTTFNDDLTRAQTNYQTDNTNASNSAKAEAILRRAAQYGLA